MIIKDPYKNWDNSYSEILRELDSTGEPPTAILSHQEFYDILCEYVEKAVKDKDAAFQAEAMGYLRLFKENYHLK